MILKHHDSIETTDKLIQSGNSAEKQMAFYLQRAFGDDEDFHILNGTRLKKGEDVCQIDHLVVHQYGMVIIESKSVTSKVKINDDGSWERIWDNHWQGMRSPFIQAKMQADFLRNYLNFHKEQVLMKVRGVQQTFDKMPIEVIVAISDSGIIDRSVHPESKFVYKADQVTSKIKEIHAEQKRLDKILTLSLKMPTWVFLKEAQERISRFIVEAHRPTAAPAPPAKKQDAQTKEVPKPEPHKPIEKPAPPKVQEKKPEYGIRMQTSTCPECGKLMEILWGDKYKNYYWKCKSCGKNVSTYEKCPKCQDKLKIRKEKTKYFLYCEKCAIEGLYHETKQ